MGIKRLNNKSTEEKNVYMEGRVRQNIKWDKIICYDIECIGNNIAAIGRYNNMW